MSFELVAEAYVCGTVALQKKKEEIKWFCLWCDKFRRNLIN